MIGFGVEGGGLAGFVVVGTGLKLIVTGFNVAMGGTGLALMTDFGGVASWNAGAAYSPPQ
jgi:hypothetical protein